MSKILPYDGALEQLYMFADGPLKITNPDITDVIIAKDNRLSRFEFGVCVPEPTGIILEKKLSPFQVLRDDDFKDEHFRYLVLGTKGTFFDIFNSILLHIFNTYQDLKNFNQNRPNNGFSNEFHIPFALYEEKLAQPPTDLDYFYAAARLPPSVHI